MSKRKNIDLTWFQEQLEDGLQHAFFPGPQAPGVPAACAATPPYQVMPPLSPLQWGALEASIRVDGIRVPIDVDEAGEILDGHQRLAIATALGIECPRRVVRGLKAADKRAYALTVNLMRRQLDGATWGMAFNQLLEARGVKRGSGSRNDRKRTCATVAQVANEVGVSRRTAYARLKKAEQATASPPRRTRNAPARPMQAVPKPLARPAAALPVDTTTWRPRLATILRQALNVATIEEIVVHVANVLQVDIVAK